MDGWIIFSLHKQKAHRHSNCQLRLSNASEAAQVAEAWLPTLSTSPSFASAHPNPAQASLPLF